VESKLFDDKHLISVVIPLYNKEHQVERAIRSVINQNYSNFELIVVDDGSTDGSLSVVKTFTDRRVRLVRREHIDSWGGHAARNLGIEESGSNLIAFLDADDEWLPEHLQTIEHLSMKYPDCGAFATSYKIVDLKDRHVNPKFKDIPEPPWEGIIPNYFRSVLATPPVWSSAVAVWKTVFSEVRQFPIGIKRGGDLDMWARIALKYPIAFSNRVSAIYYTNATSRICLTIMPPKGDNALDNTLREAIASGNYRKDIRKEDLIELLNNRALSRAIGYIGSSDKKEAWSFIKKATLTRRSFRLLLTSYILLIIPNRVNMLIKELRGWQRKYAS
jgi:glycosyltransferase involved in cell wall biosynthesis